MTENLYCEIDLDPSSHRSVLKIEGEVVPGIVAMETYVTIMVHFLNGERMVMQPFGFRHQQSVPLSPEMARTIKEASDRAMSGEKPNGT